MMLLDTTTLAEYLAESTPALQAQAVVDALADPVSVKVYDGSGNLKGSGTMATPWATQAAGVITVAEVTGFVVSASGTPDASWYLRFESGTRWLRGGWTQEVTWSLPTWTAGQIGIIGTGIIGVPSNAAPSLVGAPSTLSFTQGVGGTYNFATHGTDPNGDTPLTYSLVGTVYTGVTMSSAGLLTVSTAAAAAVRNLTIRITDPGGLSSDHACAVMIEAVGATHYVAHSTSATDYDASAVNPGDTIILRRGSGTRGPVKFIGAVGTPTAKIRIKNEAGGLLTMKRPSASSSGFVFTFEDCVDVDADFDNNMSSLTVLGKTVQYGLLVTSPSSSDAPSSWIKFNGWCKRIRLAHFMVDGLWTNFTTPPVSRVGIQIYDTDLGRTDWLEGHELTSFIVQNVAGEGVYGGPNFYVTPGPACLRNITISDFIIQDTGRDGIQTKSWISGSNSISNFVMRRIGRNTDSGETGQLFGISVLDGQADVHDGIVHDAGGSGIQLYSQYAASTSNYGSYAEPTVFESSAWNLVVVRSGAVAGSDGGSGISGGSAPTANLIKVRAHVYSVTVVDSRNNGVSFNAQADAGSIVENSILVGNGGSATSTGPGTARNNDTTATFTDDANDDYSLAAPSAGTALLTRGTNYSATAIAVDVGTGVVRGTGTSGAAKPDRGAFEYTG